MHLYLRSCSLLVQALSGFDTVSGQFLFIFILMTLQKIKYPILAIMLHLLISGCDRRHEIARIDFASMGCFHHYKSSLLIYEYQDTTKARLETEGKVREVKLSEEQLKFFNTFVEELKNLKGKGGCSTAQYYYLVMDGNTINREDVSCQWHGFNKLSEKLFGLDPSEIIQPSGS